MPLLLRTDELQPGMRLAESFVWQGRTMLPGNKQLTPEDITILCRRFPTHHVRVGDPILDELVDFESDTKEREVAKKAAKQIAKTMSEVGERFSARASLKDINFVTVNNSVNEVLEYLQDNPVSAALLDRSLSAESYLSDHAGNVFYLCMLLGSAVREYVVDERKRQTNSQNLDHRIAFDLRPLGIGAMFMDLGMYTMQDLIKSELPLTREQIAMIKEHPSTGADMLPGNFCSTARMIVRTHHENFDGSGYPQRIVGKKLHIFTRIARIADAYDAATANHVYKNAKSPARVLWEMTVGPYKHYYDPVLLKVFASLIQPFPIGAKLKLRDGRQAVVVEYNRSQPFRPVVVIAFDEHGNRLPDDHLVGPLKMEDHDELQIKSFGGEDLSYLTEAQHEIESSEALPYRFASVFEAAFP